MSAMQGRVLVAVSAPTRERLVPCLTGHEVVWVETVGQVCAAAAHQHFDMAVIGTHFDESNAFGIIRHMKQADARIRILCVRGATFTGLGPSAMHAFRAACEALGVCRVIDLIDYPPGESGTRAIREIFEQELALRAASSP
jgi:hypothetical protein